MTGQSFQHAKRGSMTAQRYERRAWVNMRSRCNNPNTPNYSRYGGRGIKVLYSSFDEFFADIGPRPSPKHSVDRIDNDGHYQVGNCRWATRSEQNNNTSVNNVVTLNGVENTVTEWARERGIEPNTVVFRLRRGWSLDRSLSAPTSKRKGEDHARCKLGEADVRCIRLSPDSDTKLAAKYGVSRRAIWSIRNGESWRHV